jgi:hypothetical protein
MSPAALRLELVEGDYAVCRLDPGAEAPAPSDGAKFHSVTRTAEELSVVCPLGDVPPGTPVEATFCVLRVSGKLPFSLTGVLAGLTTPLAAAGVSVFAVSTFDTDYLLVPSDMLGPAAEALRSAGHDVSI